MNGKERIYAAIEGRKTDSCPVGAPYLMLSNADHWEELTRLPVCKYFEWSVTSDLKWHGEMYKTFYETLPFDIVQPIFGVSQSYRNDVEVVIKEEAAFFHYKKDDRYYKLPDNIHNSGSGGGENETRYIYTKQDVRDRIRKTKAENMVSEGYNAYLDEILKLYGNTRFVVSGGVVNTFYSNVYHVGMTEFYEMLISEPELIKYMSNHILEQNIENIRMFALSGGDAVYIDDATATSDMISPKMYEEFSLPYLIPQIEEIHRQGMKAILIYFGGVADRAEMIASAGADILMMECSMKGYINDYSDISKKIGKNICLAGNLNPYTDVEISAETALESRISNMADAGKDHGRYFTSTGSPLTPNTTVERIQKYIDIAHKITM